MWRFQSTPPSRVATLFCRKNRIPWIGISIHTTLAGGDWNMAKLLRKSLYFNPHHPRGWRRCGPNKYTNNSINFNPHHPRGWRQIHFIKTRMWETISIHTTLAGGDLVMCMSIRMDTSFQSTPPSRVATSGAWSKDVTLQISIHTTLAGGDLFVFF